MEKFDVCGFNKEDELNYLHNMKICTDCGFVFSGDTQCPKCLADSTDAMLCPGCHEEYIPVDGNVARCMQCYDKIMTKFFETFREDEQDVVRDYFEVQAVNEFFLDEEE